MPRRKVPKEFVRAVAAHRNALERVLTAKASRTMKGLYDEAEGKLASKIRNAVRAGKKDTYTVHQHRIVIAQLRQGQALISRRMAGQMGPLTKMAQEQSLKGLSQQVSTLSKAFTGAEVVLPVAEAATFQGVIAKRTPSLLQMHASSMARYGTNIVQKVENKLSLSLMTAAPTYQVMDDVAETIDGEWWQGERIVRTEMAYAYNATHRDGIKASAQEIPELMQRWEEHCDDDGSPLDDRVGVDSIAIHGQVAPAGGRFTMPSSAPFPDAKGKFEVPLSLVGLSWEFPPNRPNDRSVLSPWMADWDIPGWVYRGGSRVDARKFYGS